MYFYHNIDSLFTFHLMHRYVNIRNGIFSIESVKTTKKHEKNSAQSLPHLMIHLE